MNADSRPRPVRNAVAGATSVAAAVPLLTGPGYLGALATAGIPIGRWDVLAAFALSALPTLLQLWAARRVVRTVEDQVTPTGSPRDDQGNRLRPADATLVELLQATLSALSDPDGPPTGPIRTATTTPPTSPADTAATQPTGSPPDSRHALRVPAGDGYAPWYGTDR